MKKILHILFFITIANIAFGQSKVQEIIEVNPTTDSLNNKVVKSFQYDEHGNLIVETFNNFQPLDSKYRTSGKWLHEYEGNRKVQSLLIERIDADTLKETYKHRGNTTKFKRKELITKSKIKEGLVYGDGTENGCVVPPEALEYYKVWVTRQKKKIKFKKGRIIKEIIYFDHRTNPHRLDYFYDEEGKLIKILNTNRKTKQRIWEEQYNYSSDSITRTRKYFITYWDKIPPQEQEIQYLDKVGNVEKVILTNSKDRQDGIIKYDFKNGLLISAELVDTNGETIRKHVYKY